VGSLVSRDASLPMTLTNTLNLSRATRNPFLSWELDRAWAPECLDARRIEFLEATAREGVWNSRSRHAPCSEKTTREVGLDCIYLREDREHAYVQSLVSGTTNAKVPDNTEVDGSLLFLVKHRVTMHLSPATRRVMVIPSRNTLEGETYFCLVTQPRETTGMPYTLQGSPEI
jgi:hypothetical protein